MFCFYRYCDNIVIVYSLGYKHLMWSVEALCEQSSLVSLDCLNCPWADWILINKLHDCIFIKKKHWCNETQHVADCGRVFLWTTSTSSQTTDLLKSVRAALSLRMLCEHGPRCFNICLLKWFCTLGTMCTFMTQLLWVLNKDELGGSFCTYLICEAAPRVFIWRDFSDNKWFIIFPQCWHFIKQHLSTCVCNRDKISRRPGWMGLLMDWLLNSNLNHCLCWHSFGTTNSTKLDKY